MKKKVIFLLFAATFWSFNALSQTVDPQAYYTNEKGEETATRSIADGEAPLEVTFKANPSGMEGYSPSYEWRFSRTKNGEETPDELFVRYEENTQYTFTESGNYNIVLKTRLEQDGAELDSIAITIAIADSKLVFPNAFSPNGDGKNEEFKAKEYKNIVKFRAIIINRWGQKLYEWNDPAGGWDGNYNGHPAKEGVYFVQVSAKGSDGKDYNIRKDVNLLRSYMEGGTTGGK